MDSRRLPGWALAAWLCAGPAGAAPCSVGWVCVDERPAEAGVVLVARNLKPWPLTLSARVSYENLEPRPADEVTVTVPGGGTVELVDLQVVEDGRPWRYRYRYDWTVGRLDAVHDDRYVYRLPYAGGEDWPVLQGSGSRFSHRDLEAWAVDFDMPEGTPVHAAREGTVVRVVDEHDRACWEEGCGRYANFVIVLHEDGTTGEYYHLMHRGAAVREGQAVARGELIGWSGNTGKSTMPHLHFAVYVARSWGRTQSVPVRFETRRGVVDRLHQGLRYRNPPASGSSSR